MVEELWRGLTHIGVAARILVCSSFMGSTSSQPESQPPAGSQPQTRIVAVHGPTATGKSTVFPLAITHWSEQVEGLQQGLTICAQPICAQPRRSSCVKG